jgi:hypothetical protein
MNKPRKPTRAMIDKMRRCHEAAQTKCGDAYWAIMNGTPHEPGENFATIIDRAPYELREDYHLACDERAALVAEAIYRRLAWRSPCFYILNWY